MHKIDNPSVVLLQTEYDKLCLVNERASIKLNQLNNIEYDEYGGLGTGDDIGNRAAYITLLEWLLSPRGYANPSSEFVGIRTHEGRPLC